MRSDTRTIVFRFYEELNDHLPADRRKRDFEITVKGTPAVKDTIESLGVPHTEVDLILVNGQSVGFDHRLSQGDRVSVYPMFESLDIAPASRLRPEPLRHPRFVLDVHLGRLARYLRMLGLDSIYRNDLDDPDIAALARKEQRIVLTRDRGLLKRKAVCRGYCVRSTAPQQQLKEVVRRFDLLRHLAPFTICTVCNAPLAPVAKEAIEDKLGPKTRKHYDRFFRCTGCERIYWKGSHVRRMRKMIEHTMAQTRHEADGTDLAERR